MELSSLIGIAGALLGVVLGSFLTFRAQKSLAIESHRLARTAAREGAYVEFLGSWRQFRRFLLTEELTVTLVPRDDDPQVSVAVIDGAAVRWDAVDRATAQVQILAASRSDILTAAESVRRAINTIAESRAVNAAGAVPAELVKQAKTAEAVFARSANLDIGSGK